MNNRFANIRKDYHKNTLDEKEILSNPFLQFKLWFGDAEQLEIEERNAMILSTASEKGIPSSRVVLLKGAENGNFIFFSNYNSRKGVQLAANPNAALLFFWKEMERQIRIEGSVSLLDEKNSDEYFYSRPADSQLNAIISPQSQKISDRDFLVKKRNDFINSSKQIQRPAHWGGFVLTPSYYEFWQGREGRLHDRICYQFTNSKNWDVFRLAP